MSERAAKFLVDYRSGRVWRKEQVALGFTLQFLMSSAMQCQLCSGTACMHVNAWHVGPDFTISITWILQTKVAQIPATCAGCFWVQRLPNDPPPPLPFPRGPVTCLLLPEATKGISVRTCFQPADLSPAITWPRHQKDRQTVGSLSSTQCRFSGCFCRRIWGL